MTVPVWAALLLSAGSLHADLNAGLRAFDAHDYGFAVAQFIPAAEAGNAQAQNALGYLYEHGLGITRNLEGAARWYRKSAEQGYGPGEYNFGLMCRNGQGVPQSDEEAKKWLEKASGQGIAQAAFDLGSLYYKDGKGDAVAAFRWWKSAAEQHVPAAAYNLAYLYAEGPSLPHDYEEAARWYKVAAQQNYPLAQYALGLLYQSGKGVPADPTEGRMWLELAARAGLKEAREEIASSKVALSPEQVAVARREAEEWTPARSNATVGSIRFVPVPESGPAPVRTVRIVEDSGPASYWPKGAATGYFAGGSDGLVVTSYDAVRGCQNIVLKTAGGERHAALVSQNHGLALLSADGGNGGAVALALGRPGEGKVVQVGFQLRGAEAIAQSVVSVLVSAGSSLRLRGETAPDPPLAGGPVLDASGRVIAFETNEETNPHLATAEELGWLIGSGSLRAGETAASGTDLAGVAAAAKKSLVLVECKNLSQKK